MHLAQDLLSFPRREGAVDYISKAKPQDMRGELAEIEIDRVGRQSFQIHREEIGFEFPVNVVELET